MIEIGRNLIYEALLHKTNMGTSSIVQNSSSHPEATFISRRGTRHLTKTYKILVFEVSRHFKLIGYIFTYTIVGAGLYITCWRSQS